MDDRNVALADEETSTDAEAPGRERGCAGIFLAVAFLGAVVAGAAMGGFLYYLDKADKTLARADLHSFRPIVGSKVWSDQVPPEPQPELLHVFATETRQVVPLNEMPLHLQRAFVATEDDKFYDHKGVRPDAIANALLYIVRTGNIRGGSTITQQLVRNIEQTGVSAEQSVQRKLTEALIAIQLEREFTKDEILELYLNQIFLGISAWGVEAAAQQYFDKSCRDLTLGESALLAGLARLPSRNNPFGHIENARARRDIVLEQMLDNRFVSEPEYRSALAESVDESVVTPEERAERRKNGKKDWQPDRAGYFVEEVRQTIARSKIVGGTDKAENNPLYEEGLQVHTTLDLRLQEAAERALFEGLDKFDQRRLNYYKRRGWENEFKPVSGAIVCLDNRPEYRGFVRAMVGGRDFQKQKFNMATQARRQPGSSIKPFVWAAAIELKGLGPNTMEVDEPFTQYNRLGQPWSPKNFGGDYAGPVTLRRALEKSINIVSVKLAQRITVPKLRGYLERVGITQPIDPYAGLTLALGTSTVTVLDQCVAYSVFANGGVRYDPILIKEIRDRDGIVIHDYARQPTQRMRRVMPEDLAFVMTNLLQGAATYGTGARSRELERPRAGKTGTTNDARDTWFCGFTPHFTCVVWIGYEDNTPLGDYTGGELAVPIWTAFMKEAHKGLPAEEFTPPKEGVKEVGTRGNMKEYTLASIEEQPAPAPPATPAAAPPAGPVSEDELLSTL